MHQERRLLLFTLTFCGLLGCSPAEPEPEPEPEVQRPNILVIDIDSLRSDRLTFAEDGTTTAPHIMALASEGLLFPKVVVPSGWTLPSFVTLLAGRTPSTTLLATDATQVDPSATDRMLPAILSAYGYHVGVGWGETTLSRHQLAWAWFGGQDTHDLGGIDDYTSLIAQGLQEPFFHVLHDIDLNFMREQSEAVDRSLPPIEKRAWAAAYKEQVDAGYNALLQSYDAKIGGLVEALQTAGLKERTIILLTSNHGEELSDHAPKIMGHGTILYDTVVTVPMVISAPMKTARGRVVTTPVQLQDVAPTLLDLAGVPVHAEMTGISVATALDDPEPELPRRYGYTLTFHRAAAIRAEPFKLILHPVGCAEDDRGLYPPLEGAVCQQVFNLDLDPQEKRNIARANPDLTASLRRRLLEWVRTQIPTKLSEHDAAFRAEMKRRGYWQAATGEGDSPPQDEMVRVDSLAADERVRVMPEVRLAGATETDTPMSCRILFEVDTQGVPTKVAPISCDAAYSAEVLAAAEQWRFAPWEVDGTAVPFKVVKEIRFTPSGTDSP